MTKQTRIETEAIEIDDSKIVLVENSKSFTGYSWKAMSASESSSEPGLPASVFEIAMWKKLCRTTSLLNNTIDRVRVLEENITYMTERIVR